MCGAPDVSCVASLHAKCSLPKYMCTNRESNPGQMLGRHLCYHYTIGAVADVMYISNIHDPHLAFTQQLNKHHNYNHFPTYPTTTCTSYLTTKELNVQTFCSHLLFTYLVVIFYNYDSMTIILWYYPFMVLTCSNNVIVYRVSKPHIILS